MPGVINNFLVELTAGVPVCNMLLIQFLRCTMGDVPDRFIVGQNDVALKRIKINKSIGPDLIPNRLLRTMAHVFFWACMCYH